MNSLKHLIKKKIPHRKIILFSEGLRRQSHNKMSLPVALTSWSALNAGIWQDDYFLSLDKIFSAPDSLDAIVRSIHYRRLKFGWSRDELSELTKSRTFLTHKTNATFCAIVASLLLEAEEIESCSRVLKEMVTKNTISAIDGYLALSVFAATQRIYTTKYKPDTIADMSNLISKFHSFSSLVETELQGKSIALVGNATSERGQHKGKYIDSHDHVIRFNNFSTDHRYVKDYGKKFTIWGRTPSIHEVPERNDLIIHTILFSGSFLLHVKNNNWKWMLKFLHQNINLVLFDDSAFRSLITQLDAPPSIGLLTAYNLNLLTSGLSQVSYFGFDFNTSPQNHYFDNQRPSKRHNWHTEKNIFTQITDTAQSS
jgi:hypothetical protein